MRPKNYWEPDNKALSPFGLPNRIAKGLTSLISAKSSTGPDHHAVKYIWLYVTDTGLSGDMVDSVSLSLDDWLNVVDEAAGMGAEWMVVHVGASMSANPDVWKICSWAQDTYNIKVGIHLTGNTLTPVERHHLLDLDRISTFLIVDSQDLHSFASMEREGIKLIEANIRAEDRSDPCGCPDSMACVSSNGMLYSCGLVLGEEHFALGNARQQPFSEIMCDKSLPHAIDDTSDIPVSGCSSCPPLMVKRLEEHSQNVS